MNDDDHDSKWRDRMETAVAKIADAVTIIATTTALSEERHRQTDQTLSRFGVAIEELKRELVALQLTNASNSPLIKGLGKVGTIAIALIVGAILSGILIK